MGGIYHWGGARAIGERRERGEGGKRFSGEAGGRMGGKRRGRGGGEEGGARGRRRKSKEGDFFWIWTAREPTGIFSALALRSRPLAYTSTARVVREASSSENLSVIPAGQPRPNPKEIPCLHVLRTAGKGGAGFGAADGSGGKGGAWKFWLKPTGGACGHVLRTAGTGGAIFQAADGMAVGGGDLKPLNR